MKPNLHSAEEPLPTATQSTITHIFLKKAQKCLKFAKRVLKMMIIVILKRLTLVNIGSGRDC